MKYQIQQILDNCPKNRRRNHLTADMVSYLDTTYPGVPFAYQCELVHLNNVPKCMVCDNIPAKHKTTCSRKCREQHKKDQGIDPFAAMKKYYIAEYGVDNPMKLKENQKKRVATINKTYGASVSDLTRRKATERASELNRKGRITLQDNYGVINPSQLPDHFDKCKQTLITNYGVDSFFKSEEWTNTCKDRRIRKIESQTNQLIELLDISPPDIDIADSYTFPNQRIRFKCKTCNNEEVLPSETFKWRFRQFQTPCGTCSHISSGSSAAEHQVCEFVRSITDCEVIANSRTIIPPKELDIYIPELAIAIEYCGLYWHNDNKVDKKYHYNKWKQCADLGITLITIFEDEWINKQHIVKDRLRYKLNTAKIKLFGRKCDIQPITSAVAKEFVQSHHIQGYVNASHCYGLFHETHLVAVMTFARGNASKGGSKDWELSRYCVKAGYSIAGAANKLFKQFVKDTSPSTVFTFSDLRWNTGAVYETMGFIFDKHTGLNYWYIKGNTRIHRYQLRKTNSDPIHISESILRKSEGWLRIWDCGNYKYTWHNPTYVL
jgi:predicted nucleic acid-binding Zn ribbon protein